MHLQGTWTDGLGDSYIPPQTLFAGGIITLITITDIKITLVTITDIKITLVTITDIKITLVTVININITPVIRTQCSFDLLIFPLTT